MEEKNKIGIKKANQIHDILNGLKATEIDSILRIVSTTVSEAKNNSTLNLQNL